MNYFNDTVNYMSMWFEIKILILNLNNYTFVNIAVFNHSSHVVEIIHYIENVEKENVSALNLLL